MASLATIFNKIQVKSQQMTSTVILRDWIILYQANLWLKLTASIHMVTLRLWQCSWSPIVTMFPAVV